MAQITSRSNPLCVHLRKLVHSAAYRRETGEFLCDSPKLLQEAILWGADIATILYTEDIENIARINTVKMANPSQNNQNNQNFRMISVSESVMAAVSPMKTPQGIVFSCRISPQKLPEILSPSVYLLLDGLQDPGNVGTILRTADAFGCTVFLLPGCADLYHSKTIRAAMGVHFRNVTYQTTLEQAVNLFHASNFPLYATALSQNTIDLREISLKNCGIIIGSEGQGISQMALESCDGTLKIPMRATCESLNASAAASVILWEAARTQIPANTRYAGNTGTGKEGAACQR